MCAAMAAVLQYISTEPTAPSLTSMLQSWQCRIRPSSMKHRGFANGARIQLQSVENMIAAVVVNL